MNSIDFDIFVQRLVTDLLKALDKRVQLSPSAANDLRMRLLQTLRKHVQYETRRAWHVR